MRIKNNCIEKKIKKIKKKYYEKYWNCDLEIYCKINESLVQGINCEQQQFSRSNIVNALAWVCMCVCVCLGLA